MGAEQKISASVFTHRGDGYGANTNSFILDGRYPHEFELDNSHVSMANTDRSFFFAVCDTKQTDYLNESVSGIKELRKLSVQFKSTARDIRARTEALGECFVETENLLYDTASYPDDIAAVPAQPAFRPARAADKRGQERGADADAGEGAGGPDAAGDGKSAGEGEAGGYDGETGADEYSGGVDDEPGEGAARARGFDDGDGDGDDDAPEPGSKGFSSVGFILNETKGSILAQGACTALLLRDGALRIVSGGARRGGRGDGVPAGYGGRASAVFELRDEDVFLLCTTSILNAIGEESVDSYLAMQDDVSAICSTIMRDAVQADPSSNMTCMVLRIEESFVEEALNPIASRQQDFRFAPQPVAGRATQPTMAAQFHQPPEYPDQDPRMVQAPARAPMQYPTSDTFTRRATTRFQPPPKPLSFGGNRNLLISVCFTGGLIVILFTSLYFFNKAQNTGAQSETSSSTRASQTTPGSSQPTTSGDVYGTSELGEDDIYVGAGDVSTTPSADNSFFSTTLSTTTEATTTEEQTQIYIVKKDDTLTKIAQQFYNASRYYPLIKEANGLESDNINVGQKLIIPPKPTPEPTASPAGDGGGADAASNVTAPRTSTQ